MTNWGRRTVVALRNELRRRGLRSSGRKAALVERLRASDEVNERMRDGNTRPTIDTPTSTMADSRTAHFPQSATILAEIQDQSSTGIDSSLKAGNDSSSEASLFIKSPNAGSPLNSPAIKAETDSTSETTPFLESPNDGSPQSRTAIKSKAGSPSEVTKSTGPSHAVAPKNSMEPGILAKTASEAQKRKRRSLTPEPLDREAMKKRARTEDVTVGFVRNVPPAIHPTTVALYIDNLTRPLQPEQLKIALMKFAAPPDEEADKNVIVSFFIDRIKTHALVVFASCEAASRVREALHGRAWPDENMSLQLWIDFLPAKSAEIYVKMEQEELKLGQRWRMLYEKGPGDSLGTRYIRVKTQSAGPMVTSMHHVTSTAPGTISVPSGTRAPRAQPPPSPAVLNTTASAPARVLPPPALSDAPSVAPAAQGAPSTLMGPPAHGFQPPTRPRASRGAELDPVIKDTETALKMTYRRVAETVAKQRLAALKSHRPDGSLGGDWRVGDEMNHYWFEDGSTLVNGGADRFSAHVHDTRDNYRPIRSYRGNGRTRRR